MTFSQSSSSCSEKFSIPLGGQKVGWNLDINVELFYPNFTDVDQALAGPIMKIMNKKFMNQWLDWIAITTFFQSNKKIFSHFPSQKWILVPLVVKKAKMFSSRSKFQCLKWSLSLKMSRLGRWVTKSQLLQQTSNRWFSHKIRTQTGNSCIQILFSDLKWFSILRIGLTRFHFFHRTKMFLPTLKIKNLSST